jgi:hypothetical protein
MVSPVAVVGLSWDGFDVQRPDLDIFVEIAEGLDELPQVRGGDQVVPFRSGRLPSPAIADWRVVVCNGWIAGSGAAPRASFRAYLDALKAKLDQTSEPRLLVATLETGALRWIRATPRNLLPGPGIGGEFRTFSVEWRACDPYWYGSWGALILDSGLRLDAGLFLDGSADVVVAGSASLDPKGTADTERVRVVFTGPSVGPVGIETSGSEPIGFTIARTLVAGEVVTVDNFARSATLGGVSVRSLMSLRAANLHGEYIRLPPGPVTLRALGGAAETRVQFSPAYQ